MSTFSRSLALAFVVAATLQAQSPQLQNGIKLLEQNKRAEARAVLVPYAKANPKDPMATFYVGRLMMEEGEALLSQGKEKEAIAKYQEATNWLEKAVEMDKKNSEYHRWLGDAYGRQAQRANKLRQGMLARKVKNEYEEAIRLDPTNVEARESVIEFYLLAPGFMGGSVVKAENEAREVQKLDKLRGHYVLSSVYSRQNKHEPAIAEMKTAERDYPDSLGPALRVGVLQVQAKRYDDAFAQFDEMLKRFPNAPMVTYQIGRTASVSGLQLDRGEQAMKTYLAGPAPTRGMPAFANAHYRLGLIYEKKGNIASARAEYTQALKLNPQLKDAQTALEKLPKA